jgi:Xaa-Pro aminopeptidase
MRLSRRRFIRDMGLGLAGAGLAAERLAAQAAGKESGSEKLLLKNPAQPEPAPPGFDRLPLAWNQRRVRDLKDKVAARGVDAILFRTDANIIYFSGCFRSSGERPTWVLFPGNEKDTIYWYSPGIDRDLISSWWSTENEFYFCFPHAEGGFPNRGLLAKGTPVDLFVWMLRGLERHGLDGKTIGTDWALDPDEQKKAAAVLPGSRFIDIAADCLGLRIIKTAEEIALTQRAFRYFDKIHAFSRDYVLERGTAATDFEIGQALQAYGIGLMMKDIAYDGRPHKGVGLEVTSHYVRAGAATAYPHPNQFFFNRVRRGEPLYINTDIKLGGYGGEGYRNYLIAPWTPHQEKIWDVVTESVRLMVEEAKPGRACCDVAYKVHSHQVKSGLQDYIYHRPGHGQGQVEEGHQPPFLSLGDETEIKEGMMFSVEPGLYDIKSGIGVNPSDNLLITAKGAVLMSRVPYSKEWSFLTL